MGFIADSLNRISPSATIGISTKARELKAKGRDIIALPPASPISTRREHQGGRNRALAESKTKYTDVDGIPELKAAIVAKLKRENELTTSRARSRSAPAASRCCITRCLHAQSRRRNHHAGALLGVIRRHRPAR